jgi:alkanesulfonate monooxygenase SsuD/methylene tetrahydromethanopterin reductase-like flavin-dependent oxidoreductase (luciferase family)
MSGIKKDSPESFRRDPVFGLSIVPKKVDQGFKLANVAEELGLDIIGIQDHPYDGSFLDTWTFISILAASTKKIRFFA